MLELGAGPAYAQAMADVLQTPVAIAGGGPTGLCLAMDLADRGVDCIVIERRPAGEPPSVKCNHVASRTMEAFRRMGFANQVREAGLPADYPNDVVIRTRATGRELTRIHIPCRRDRYTDQSGPDGWWPTPEPPHRINQLFLEPILFANAAAKSRVTLLNQTEFVSLLQDEEGVSVEVRDLQSGKAFKIRADYLVGCDGGSSQVRREIGSSLSGRDVIQRVQSSYIRAPDLIGRVSKPDAWMSYLYAPERAGNLLAIDGRETWLIHNYLLPQEADFESVDRDACIRLLLGVGPDFEYELLGKEDWVGRRLVADRFHDRRVFICGDAAHLWVPYAGYGMNAGIADALNLSWKLAGRLNGWAPESILAAYHAERQPITDQVSRFAMDHAEKAIRERTSVPADIEDDTAEAAEARRRIGDAAYRLHVQQFACAGLNFGYYYGASPLIADDGETPPAYTMFDYRPSSVPGCRTPHFWLRDGRSLYDALGPDFTLLRFDPSADVSGLMSAAADVGLPMDLLDIQADELPDAYRHRLVLSRPDQHVAWRENQAPTDPKSLIDRVRGALASTPRQGP